MELGLAKLGTEDGERFGQCCVRLIICFRKDYLKFPPRSEGREEFDTN